MPTSCVAYNCRSRWTKTPGTVKISNVVSFHRFPLRNKELLKKWIIAVRRKSWKPTNASFLCSKHFTPDCFYYSPSQFVQLNGQRRKLRPDSVPSVFQFPKHLQNSNKKRRPPLKRKTVDITPEEESYVPSKKTPNLDHSYAISLSNEINRMRKS